MSKIKSEVFLGIIRSGTITRKERRISLRYATAVAILEAMKTSQKFIKEKTTTAQERSKNRFLGLCLRVNKELRPKNL